MIRYYLGEEPLLEKREDLPARRSRAARARSPRRIGELVASSRPASRAVAASSSARTPRRGDSPPSRPRSEPTSSQWTSRRSSSSSRRCRPCSPTARLRHASRRSAPVRGLRRADPDSPRRVLTRVALEAGLDGRQLLPRRRLEGHLECSSTATKPALPPRAPDLPPFTPPALPDLRLGSLDRLQAQQQQQQQSARDPY